MRFLKRKARTHRKANTRGWKVVFRPGRAPEGGHDSGPLPLPQAASMKQRTVELPKLPARTAYPSAAESHEYTRIAALAAAERVTTAVAHRSAYQIDPDVPLFRDERTLTEYEDRYQARLRQLQRITHPWPDAHGVNLGSDQSPKTITWTTAAYREFAASQDPKQVSR